METYQLLQIGYSKDMRDEDAEILDLIPLIHGEMENKNQSNQ